MSEYSHHISGFFAQREAAENAYFKLVERGLPRVRLHIFKADKAGAVAGLQSDSNEVLKNVLVDGAVGTAVGTGLGALGELALVAANVSLFIASPLIAPLAMLGWGASLGALIGTAVGASVGPGKKNGRFADLIRDAISSGQVVLVAQTRTEQETAIAKEIIQASVGDYKESIAA